MCISKHNQFYFVLQHIFIPKPACFNYSRNKEYNVITNITKIIKKT